MENKIQSELYWHDTVTFTAFRQDVETKVFVFLRETSSLIF